MKILVIGSGLLGVCTAYFLQRRGHEVSVVDRSTGPGNETSFANGSLLTPSMSNPWNSPGCWRVLLSSLVRSDSPMQLRLAALPSLAGWGLRFLANSNAKKYRQSTLINLRLAEYSLKVMEELRGEAPFDYHRSARGTLRIFRTRAALEHALEEADALAQEGLPYKAVSSRDIPALEPALQPVCDQLVGGILYEADESGDAHLFCIGVKAAAEKAGVQFYFDTDVQLVANGPVSIAEVAASGRRFVADRYILCAGSYSPRIASVLGFDLPVRPVKGYSLTIRQPLAQQPLQVPLVDDEMHAVVTPLGDSIRVAGTAEFAGYDLQLRPERVQNLVNVVRAVLPQAVFESTQIQPWCGLRPMCVDGVPIVSATPCPQLFVNTGHGHLGWTMAAGSAKLLSDLVDSATPSLDPAPFALTRFGV